MKNAIELIREGYTFAGITPTGSTIKGDMLNGNMNREGLEFLNELLYRWNADNYFPFTSNTLDCHIRGGRALIGGVELGAFGDSVFIGPKPININKVLYRYGNEWFDVSRLGYENIWERKAQSSQPSFFAFTNDPEGNGVIEFDCENGDFDCRIIYNRDLPPMDFNDELTAPPQYQQALKYGIAALVAARYGMPPDVQAKIERLRDSILTAIKKTNSFKHAINRPMRNHFVDDPAMAVLCGRHL